MAQKATTPTSKALKTWQDDARKQLEEIETAHAAVGGIGPGRRFATLQINYAYTMLLSAQFQRFCRDLHSEAAFFLVSLAPPSLRAVFRSALLLNRKLDVGNPNPGHIGSDFGRLGIGDLWDGLKDEDRRNRRRQAVLEELNLWRNAVGHQDFSKVGPELRLHQVRTWRKTCEGLAVSLDAVVHSRLHLIGGSPPW